MDDWTWRETVASWIHRLGYRISPEEGHDILVRDGDGQEILSIATSGGWAIIGPPEPYTLHCRHFADDDDLVGEVHDL